MCCCLRAAGRRGDLWMNKRGLSAMRTVLCRRISVRQLGLEGPQTLTSIHPGPRCRISTPEPAYALPFSRPSRMTFMYCKTSTQPVPGGR